MRYLEHLGTEWCNSKAGKLLSPLQRHRRSHRKLRTSLLQVSWSQESNLSRCSTYIAFPACLESPSSGKQMLGLERPIYGRICSAENDTRRNFLVGSVSCTTVAKWCLTLPVWVSSFKRQQQQKQQKHHKWPWTTVNHHDINHHISISSVNHHEPHHKSRRFTSGRALGTPKAQQSGAQATGRQGLPCAGAAQLFAPRFGSLWFPPLLKTQGG